MLRLFKVSRAPVPVESFASQLGVRVLSATNFGSLEGALEHDSGQPTIWVNAGHSRTKKRFTIAHELGHLMLHPEGKMFRELSYVGPFSQQKEEREANTFAAHLLMPLHFLEPFVGSKRMTDSYVAQAFEVSEAVLRWQLEALRAQREALRDVVDRAAHERPPFFSALRSKSGSDCTGTLGFVRFFGVGAA